MSSLTKQFILLVFLLLFVSVTIAACGAGNKAITQGTLRDTIFNHEPRVNGTISIWMTHDDVGVYCTLDKALGDKALSILRSNNAEVIITYRSLNNNDPEHGGWIDITDAGCGDSADATRYKLLTIEPVPVN